MKNRSINKRVNNIYLEECIYTCVCILLKKNYKDKKICQVHKKCLEKNPKI